VFEFARDDVQQMAESYDPQVYAAPIQIDHEGTVKSGHLAEAAVVGEHLVGVPDAVDPQFAKLAQGREISLQLYTPTASDNPKPGKWGIAHVALVRKGALALMPPMFSRMDDEHPIFESGGISVDKLVQFLQSLRDAVAAINAELAEQLITAGDLESLGGGDESVMQNIVERFTQALVGEQSEQGTTEGSTEPPAYSAAELELQVTRQKLRELELGLQLDEKIFKPAGGGAKLPMRHRAGLLAALKHMDVLPEFEVSNQQLSPVDYIINLLADLPPVVPTGKTVSLPAFRAYRPTPDEIREYQKQAAGRGEAISFAAARTELINKQGGQHG
jgi:hypothetical protein